MFDIKHTACNTVHRCNEVIYHIENRDFFILIYTKTEAVFEIHNIMKHTTEEFRIDLTEFPKRPPKTTRISVDFKYLTENKFQITITDLGFGEFFKSSGMSVTKEIEIG